MYKAIYRAYKSSRGRSCTPRVMDIPSTGMAWWCTQETHHRSIQSSEVASSKLSFSHFGWANKNWLVVEPPIWKNIRQHGNLPQIGVNIKKKYLKPPPKRKCYYYTYLMTLMTVFLWVLALHSDTRNQPAKVYWINRTHDLSWQFHRIITPQKRQVGIFEMSIAQSVV